MFNLNYSSFVALAICLQAGQLWAVPAAPDKFDVHQPNGDRISLYLRGDENFHWHETEDGFSVVKDPTDATWKYATVSPNNRTLLGLSNSVVGNSDPKKLGLNLHTIPSIQKPQRLVKGGSTSEIKVLQPKLNTYISGKKTVRNIVILAAFSDHWNINTVKSSQGYININEYSNLFNQISYTNGNAVGSVRDYYKEVSYGKMDIQSIIVPWVKLPQSEAYYGANNGSDRDVNAYHLASDAVQAASTAGFDFSQGDADGDGWVDCLTIIHSGYGEEIGSNPSTCVWSHQWSMDHVLTFNGVKLHQYTTEPAMRGTVGTIGVVRIGVICHELGHFFGLPDLYDYSGATGGLGNWCIMSGGCWNGLDGRRPSHFSAWAKYTLGFLQPTILHSQYGLQIPRIEDTPYVGMLRDNMTDGEYFLVENRSKIGFDNDNNIYPGLLISHIYSQSGNNDLQSWAHPLVKIEEADGNDSLGLQMTSSEPTDVWSSTTSVLPGGFNDQTGISSANAMRYNSNPYNRANNVNLYTYNKLKSFSKPSSKMSCEVSSLKTGIISQSVTSAVFFAIWAPVANATKYDIQEGLLVTNTAFQDNAESEEFMLENWWFRGSARRSNKLLLGNYCYILPQLFENIDYSSVQSITLRQPVKLTANSTLSFSLLAHLSPNNGYLKVQISANGDDWFTLDTIQELATAWQNKTYKIMDYPTGLVAGNSCWIRFQANYEQYVLHDEYPFYGIALDDIYFTNIETPSYTDWTTVASNTTSTIYTVKDKQAAIYAYKIRAFCNNNWQEYGPVGTITSKYVIDNNFTYTTNNGTINITSYTGSQPSVIIPAQIYRYPVTSIDTNAFKNCTNISNITLPATLSSIANGAFYNCNKLSSIAFPETLTNIGNFAFAYCQQLVTITLPSRTLVQAGAFASCLNLYSISVPDQNPYHKSINGILYDKQGSVLIQYPAGQQDNIIPAGTVIIAEAAFKDCIKLSSLVLPASLQQVNATAFNGCSNLLTLDFTGEMPQLQSTFSGLNAIVYYPIDKEWTPSYGGLITQPFAIKVTINNTINNLILNIQGPAALFFTLESSTNLINWVTMARVANGNQVVDKNAVKQFYRIK